MKSVKVTRRYLRSSPTKVGLVCGLIKKSNVQDALALLRNLNKKVAKDYILLINSGIAALKEAGVDEESIKIEKIKVDKGPVMKRTFFRARGRAARIKKRFSHLTVVLASVAGKEKSGKKDAKSFKEK